VRLDQLAALGAAGRHPRGSRRALVAFQDRQLRRLVAHAYAQVPYYRRLFDRHGLKPGDIRSTADLTRVPITSKSDLQLLPATDVVSRGTDPDQLIVRLTSGASGEPFRIRRTWLEERLLNAFRLRALRSCGLRLSDRVVSVTLVRQVEARDHQILHRALQAVGLRRVHALYCRLPPQEALGRLEVLRPDVLIGYPGVLARLAQALENSGRPALRPRFVGVGGEVLTPLMRRQIGAAFATPVYDLYGSHEFNLLAWECRATGHFHTCDDGLILEVVKGARSVAPGERGEVVGTNLHSFAMPFIRYRLGDLVTRGPEVCPCGQPFSTIAAVQGRMLDYFVLPDGEEIYPYEILARIFLGQPLREMASAIRQYQLLQEREDHIVFRVVLAKEVPHDWLSRIAAQVAPLFGPRVAFHVLDVPAIPLEPSGKFRVARSVVQSAYANLDWDRTPFPFSTQGKP
jgi:phenylacetate-CoA ligase